MRGKANVPADELRDTRITPAYAGKSTLHGAFQDRL